jgi:hypothetical protein
MYQSSIVADFAVDFVDFTTVHILPSFSWIYSTWNPKSTGNFQNMFFFLLEHTNVFCCLPEFALEYCLKFCDHVELGTQ